MRQGRWSGFIPWGSGGQHHAGDSDELDWEVAFDPDAEHPPLIPSGYPSEAFRDSDTFRMLRVVHRIGKPTPAFATWKDYEAWDGESQNEKLNPLHDQSLLMLLSGAMCWNWPCNRCPALRRRLIFSPPKRLISPIDTNSGTGPVTKGFGARIGLRVAVKKDRCCLSTSRGQQRTNEGKPGGKQRPPST